MGIIKKAFISVFIVIHLMIMIAAGLPDRSAVGKEILGTMRSYQIFFGLDQSWSMFAPNPASKNSYMDAIITFKDKTTEKWTFPRASHLEGWERFTSGERLRKYQQENLVPLQKMELWYDLAHFLEKEINKIEKKGKGRVIDQIQFFRHFNIVKSPTEKFVEHGRASTEFKTESVFIYKSTDRVRYEAKNNN